MIRPALKADTLSLAKLHRATLTSSFLAKLGLSFLDMLYAFFIKKGKIWVYEDANEIKGFISFSQNSAGMMKQFLISCPSSIFLLVMRTVTHPSNIKRLIETFCAPLKSKKNNDSEELPSGELLSIAVSPDCQVSGIGSQLITALEEYLKQNKISSYKVIAGQKLEGANKFYQKNGFILAKQITIHGNDVSNVYVKEIEK